MLIEVRPALSEGMQMDERAEQEAAAREIADRLRKHIRHDTARLRSHAATPASDASRAAESQPPERRPQA